MSSSEHPIASPIYEDKLLQGPIKYISPVIYDNINAALIRKCAVRTNGASGPSGLDADCWKKMIGGGSFGAVSDDLCHAIALMTRQLCIDESKDPGSISAISACRLIPLDKCPGLRPIGIGEVIRRIMGKSVMQVLKKDILNVTGYDQLCSGLEAGCEAGFTLSMTCLTRLTHMDLFK